MTTAIIVFAHGSRVESANEGVRAIAAELAQASSFFQIEAAFLELGRPSLAEAVDRLATQRVDRIVVIPYFLTLGLHLERDLPRMIAQLREAYPSIQISVTPPLEGHPALLQILLDRSKEAT